jgi:hypothetical protein
VGIASQKNPGVFAGVFWVIVPVGLVPDQGVKNCILLKQVVGNAVAFTTLLGVDFHLRMRLPVTSAAQRNLRMGRMAVRTGDGCVLGYILLEFVIHVVVTPRANE